MREHRSKGCGKPSLGKCSCEGKEFVGVALARRMTAQSVFGARVCTALHAFVHHSQWLLSHARTTRPTAQHSPGGHI
jgi:hypothetical protein